MSTLMKLISTTTVPSGGLSSIQFTSIPQTFTDLLLVYDGDCNRSDLVADGVFIRFNSDTTGSNYNNTRLYGNPSGGSTFSDTGAVYGGAGLTTANATASVYGSNSIYIPNYTSSVAKTWVVDGGSENDGSNTYLGVHGGRWTGTAAISSISLIPEVGTSWNQFTTASLYGIYY